MDDLKAKHDELMQSLPDGVDHAEHDCPWCVMESKNEPEGGEMSKTYTEEEFNLAVAELLAPIQAELDALKATKTEEDIQARITEAVEAAEASKAELQNSLDVAQAELEAVKQERDDIVAFLQAEVDAAEKAAELAARKEDRVERIKAVASYKDEYVEANADRWAAMDDEDFDSLIGDIAAKTSSEDRKEDDPKDLLRDTAMKGREGSDEGKNRKNLMRDVLRMPFNGLDPRTF